MAETKTWSLIWDGSNGTSQLKLNFESTYDDATNTSILKLTSIQVQNNPTYGVPYYIDGVLEINGTEVITFSTYHGTHYVNCGAADTWYDVKLGVTTAELEVPHNVDGGKSVTVRFIGRKLSDNYDSNGGYDVFTITDQGSSTWTVDGDQNLDITDTWRGLVYIDNGESFVGYQVYIDNGTSWDLYIPYVDNGTSWDICS